MVTELKRLDTEATATGLDRIEVIQVYFLDMFESLLTQLDEKPAGLRDHLRGLFDSVGQSYDELSALVGHDRFPGVMNMIFSAGSSSAARRANSAAWSADCRRRTSPASRRDR